MLSWNLSLWLVCFLLVAALLGLIMYMFICLSDLENDFINPHDSASRINKCIFPEYIAQGVLTTIFLLSGRWFLFVCNAPLVVHHVRKYSRKEHLIDETEIFNVLAQEKRYRLLKLLFYLLLIVIVIYRLVEAGVSVLLVEDN
ncbi:hypothetical protein CBR_g18650 [Chara braunii]|uniref:Cornichon n=1 Tax=Chara braunii TaxID=69332 RepID=A0A388JTC9_CHABU|nr:hypothetical protein CBR_g18650 [Chara braunii]|eukprot:GBG61058.1 hypothetical protein CBR_g18650 [Chara braunii]